MGKAKATDRPSGMTNNQKVTCPKCGQQVYVNPNAAKRMGGWKHC